MRTLNSTWWLFIALSFTACSANKSESEDDFSSADSVSSHSDISVTEEKLVKTASMDFKVKDVYQSSRLLSEQAGSLGGMVSHQRIKTSVTDSKSIPFSKDSLQVISCYETHAEMSVRVPSQHLEEFLHRVSSNASFINTSSLDIDDRSIDYHSQELRMQSRKDIMDSQLSKSNIKTKDALTLADQQELVIDHKINNLRTDAEVRFSVVDLNFFQNVSIKKELIANNDLDIYAAPFMKRLVNAILIGCILFADFIIAISHLWLFIFIGVICWLGFLYYKRKKKLAYSGAA